MFPYGDDKTRRMVSDMLEELESHAWKNGDIVDTGKHNDLVMALAHAIDQFSAQENSVPIVMGSMKKAGWTGGKVGPQRSRGNALGGKVVRRRL